MTIFSEQAKFSQHRNDMYWSIWVAGDGTLRWTGYDDTFWWANVARSDDFREKVGSATLNTYTLDPETGIVTVRKLGE